MQSRIERPSANIIVTAFLVLAAMLPSAPASGSPVRSNLSHAVGDQAHAQERESTRSNEVVSKRTRTSRTFTNSYGAYETEIFPGSIHYRGSEGTFKPIENDLVADSNPGFAHRNKANRYTLRLPAGLGSAPVRFEMGGEFASFTLKGAQGQPSVSSNSAVYREALPGVEVRYSSLNDLVKEELILGSSESTRSFSWRLQTSPGLTPRETAGGGIDFTTDEGQVLFSMPPPEIWDSASPEASYAPQHRFRLSTSNGVREIALAVDTEWLSAPARVFPITVDPPIAVGKRDCWIENKDKSGNTYCTGSNLRVGFNGIYKRRALVEFDMSQFPSNAEVLNARFGLYLESALTNNATRIDLKRVTTPWDTSVSWDDTNGSTLWDTQYGGGDIDSPGYDQPSVGAGVGWKYWYPTELVDKWIAKGGDYNDGLLLKQNSETIDQTLFFSSFDNAISAQRPQLTVIWDNGGMGELKNYKHEEHRLTNRMDEKVNVAGGNLLIKATDFNVPGRGLDFSLDRYYNSLVQTQHITSTGTSVGEGWTLNVGTDVGLLFYGDGSAALVGPSGYRLAFPKDPLTGEFQKPAGLDADLSFSGDPNRLYTLEFRNNEEELVFNDGGKLIKHKDKNGNSIEYAYTNGQLDFITDTQGRTFDLSYNAAGDVSSITTPDGGGSGLREYTYRYDDQNRLISYSSPASDLADSTGRETTRYDYYADDTLKKITDAEGHETIYEYSTQVGEERFVTAVTRVTDNAADTGPKTTFSYEAATAALCKTSRPGVTQATIVYGPRGLADDTTYCYNDLSRVEAVVDADGNLTTATYDANANITSTENANGAKAEFGFDPASGNLTSTLAPETSLGAGGAATKIEYQNLQHPHFPTLITDAEGHQTKREYDGPGNLVKVIKGFDTNSPVTFSYEYNYPHGTLKRIEAPPVEADPTVQGNDTTFDYFPDGSLKTITRPAPRGSESLSYDALGRTTVATDGKSQATNYDYDAEDRIERVDYADGSAVLYAYDDVGNIRDTTDVDPSGTTSTETFTYDERNLLRTENKGTETTTYGYNEAGALNTLADSFGKTEYRYDKVNVLSELITGADTLTPETITYGHNSTYQHTSKTFPGGSKQASEYSKGGSLTSISGTKPSTTNPFTKQTYDYTSGGSDKGLVQKETDLAGKATTYTYDGLSRLTDAVTKDGTTTVREFHYTYDVNSNRTCEREIKNGATTITNFTYNNANELAKEFEAGSCGATPQNETLYDYDANGSLSLADIPGTTDDDSFNYDARDHTARIDPAGQAPVDMAYQGPTQQERETKTVGGTLPSTTSYTYDALGLRSESSPTQTQFIREPNGDVIGFMTPASVRYFIKDLRGSVVAVINKNGDVLQEYTYEPFGEIHYQSDPGFVNPWRFAQGYFDNETGLYKLGVRYYDPNAARFTQTDPVFGDLKEPITLNQYQYAGCDPANNVDPTGRSHQDYGAALEQIFSFAEGCVPGLEVGGLLGSFTPFPVAGPALGAALGCTVFGFASMAGLEGLF